MFGEGWRDENMVERVPVALKAIGGEGTVCSVCLCSSVVELLAKQQEGRTVVVDVEVAGTDTIATA